MRVRLGGFPIPLDDYPTLPEGTTVISPGEWALGKRLFAAIDVSQSIVLAAHNDLLRDLDDITDRDCRYAYASVQRTMAELAISESHLSRMWNGEHGSMSIQLNNPSGILLVEHRQ